MEGFRTEEVKALEEHFSRCPTGSLTMLPADGVDEKAAKPQYRSSSSDMMEVRQSPKDEEKVPVNDTSKNSEIFCKH